MRDLVGSITSPRLNKRGKREGGLTKEGRHFVRLRAGSRPREGHPNHSGHCYTNAFYYIILYCVHYFMLKPSAYVLTLLVAACEC